MIKIFKREKKHFYDMDEKSTIFYPYFFSDRGYILKEKIQKLLAKIFVYGTMIVFILCWGLVDVLYENSWYSLLYFCSYWLIYEIIIFVSLRNVERVHKKRKKIIFEKMDSESGIFYPYFFSNMAYKIQGAKAVKEMNNLVRLYITGWLAVFLLSFLPTGQYFMAALISLIVTYDISWRFFVRHNEKIA